MKKPMIAILFLFSTLSICGQGVGINETGAAPDDAAILDVSATDKGLLIPRISLSGTNDISTIPAPVESLMVYNTNTISDVSPGFYYWEGSKWTRLNEVNNDHDFYEVGQTIPADAITDDIYTQGNVGIGETNPAESLDVNGNTTTNGLQVGPGNMFSNMQGGRVDIGASGGQEIVVIYVTFPTPFSGIPNVICTASAQPGTIFDDSFNITTREITNTGFAIIVNRIDGSTWGQDIDACWFAFE